MKATIKFEDGREAKGIFGGGAFYQFTENNFNMTIEEYENLQVHQKVSMTVLSFKNMDIKTKLGYITKIYNGNYQVQVLFDGDPKPRTIGYSQLNLVID